MKYIGILCVFFLLQSCGGGGGNSSSFDISFDRASFDLNIDYKQSIDEYDSEYYVRVNYIGETPSSPIFVLVSFDQEHIENVHPHINESNAALRVVPQPDLEPGDYSGNISIQLCADASCNRNLGNRDQYTLPYNFDVKYAYLQIATTVGDLEVPRYERFSSYTPLVVTIPYVVGEEMPPVFVDLQTSHNADTIYFPQDIIEEYQIEKVSDQQFIFNPKPHLIRTSFRKDYVLSVGRPGRSTTTDFSVVMEPRGTELDELSMFPNKIQLNMKPDERPISTIYYAVLPYGETEIYYEFENPDDQSWVIIDPPPIYNGRSIIIDPSSLDNGTHEANVFFWSGGSERETINIKVSISSDNPSQSSTELPLRTIRRSDSVELSEENYRLVKRSEFTWSATTDSPWIILENNSGASNNTAGSSFHDSHINWSFDLERLRALPFFNIRHVGHIEINMDGEENEDLFITIPASTGTGSSLYYAYPLEFTSDERVTITIAGDNLRNKTLVVGDQEININDLPSYNDIDLGFLSAGEHSLGIYDPFGFSSGEFVIVVTE